MKNVSYQLLISLRLQVVIKTLRNLALSKMFLEKQPFTFIKKSRSEKCLKIRRKAQKAPVEEFHFNAIAVYSLRLYLKKRLKRLEQCSECFAMTFSKFCRVANFMSTSGRPVLDTCFCMFLHVFTCFANCHQGRFLNSTKCRKWLLFIPF